MENIRLLLVDDHSVIRSGLRMLLEAQDDMTIIGEADSGRTAIAQVRELQPDVVLMDINMPEMDGAACIEEILKYDPAANISIISGYEQEGIDSLSEKARKSIKYFRTKPLGLVDLSELLAGMLKG